MWTSVLVLTVVSVAHVMHKRMLFPGDLVTETGTPGGPWFRVISVESCTGTVTVEAEPGLHVVIAVRCWDRDAVLPRVPVLEAGPRAGAHPLTPGL